MGTSSSILASLAPAACPNYFALLVFILLFWSLFSMVGTNGAEPSHQANVAANLLPFFPPCAYNGRFNHLEN